MANFCKYKNLQFVDIAWNLPGNPDKIRQQYNTQQLSERDLSCLGIIETVNWGIRSVNKPNPIIPNGYINYSYYIPNNQFRTTHCFFGLLEPYETQEFTNTICPVEILARPDTACANKYWAFIMDGLWYGATFGIDIYYLQIFHNNVTTYEFRPDGGKVTAAYNVKDQYGDSHGVGELSFEYLM